MNRLAEIKTPLPDGKLLFYKMEASERLAESFSYEIDLLSEDDQIAYSSVLGQKMTVALQLQDGGVRHFDGYVVLFGLTGRQGRYFVYHASVRPWTWFLSQTRDCRIFQGRNAVENTKFVFGEHRMAKVKDLLVQATASREYCVQYRETDFSFFSRLLEEEGIYYYFTHDSETHTLVLADSQSAHAPYPGYEAIEFLGEGKSRANGAEGISSWVTAEEVRTGVYTMDDYDPLKSRVDLQVTGDRVHTTSLSDYEIYDYPGKYTDTGNGNHLLRTRLEEIQTACKQFTGSTNARGIAVGHTFTAARLPRVVENTDYLVVSTDIVVVQADYEGIGQGEGSSFECTFTAAVAEEAWRPARVSTKPVVQGPQTGEVVGPDGDEIHTDSYGRVKVLFHWDRERRRLGQPELSSCWVRVSQAWAGKNFGFIAIPRIGQEVIVDFLEGDPDRPIITGRVYNDQQMPPWALPEHKTRTGLVTRSTTGGNATTANELRFEDKKGHEQVYLHAERSLDTEVEGSETRDVGGDRTTHIHGTDRLTVDKDRHEHVNGDYRTLFVEGLSNRTIRGGEVEAIDYGLKTTIKGGHALTVEDGGQSINIKDGIDEKVQGSVIQDIWGGGYTQMVTGGGHTEVIEGGAGTYTASEGFSFTTPAKYEITAGSGVTITTPSIKLLGGATLAEVTQTKSMFAAEQHRVTGAVYEFRGLNAETRVFHLSGVSFKGESIGFKNSKAAMDKIASGLELRNVATTLASGGLHLARKVMTLFV